ncbi:MAG TPA: glycosyl hydrolase family 17 protein [Acetobacteraceae bacterium]|nr:glycosyl hydrolase family 17 protein [Acetobacteraceae bacterium]
MAPAPSNFVMGMNFSNEFQSNPIAPDTAATQLERIVGIPNGMVKTFSLAQRTTAFIKDAFMRGTLSLAVGSSNDDIERFATGNTQGFLDQIAPYVGKIPWICVGNEPLGSWYNGKYNAALPGAVENLSLALGSRKWNIGVTVPQNFEFMQISYPPSAGTIKPELAGIIKSTCATMKSTGAPFMVNIYPFLTRLQNPRDVPLDYCLFTAQQDHWVHDGPYTYKNIFDAMLDALHVALAKIGFGDLEIVVGECGWPTAGATDANNANAQTFLQNLINHCKSGAGTPRMPGRKLPCFVFEAYDEDQKSTAPGPFETHWGVYNAGGTEKFPLKW